MNLKFDDARFGRELPLWAVRGLLCAAPSAVWAVLVGFKDYAAIVGMLAGIVWWVAVMAWLCAQPRWADGRLVPLLKLSAWLKAGFGLVSMGLFWMPLQARVGGGFGVLPAIGEMLLGVASLWLTCLVRGHGSPEELASADSLGWTTLATVLNGAMIIILILLLALAMRALLGSRPKISPARIAG